MPAGTLAHRVPARLVLPVIITTREREPILGPDDLRAHLEAGRLERGLHRACVFARQIPAREDSGHGHGTQKPVECMRRPIANNSSPGQAVYDPFVGSGTSIIAAEMTGRACHAIEIDPVYVDVAVQRWQDFTGAQAVHQDGRAFASAPEREAV